MIVCKLNVWSKGMLTIFPDCRWSRDGLRNMHMHHFIGHFLGKPGLAGYPVIELQKNKCGGALCTRVFRNSMGSVGQWKSVRGPAYSGFRVIRKLWLPLDFQSPLILILSILTEQAKTVHIPSDTIPPRLLCLVHCFQSQQFSKLCILGPRRRSQNATLCPTYCYWNQFSKK